MNGTQIPQNICSNTHKIAERIRKDDYLCDDLLEEIKRDVELLHDKDTQELKAAIKTFEDGPPKNMAAQEIKYYMIGKADAICTAAGKLFGPIFEDYLGMHSTGDQS